MGFCWTKFTRLVKMVLVGNSSSRRLWADLPEELLVLIGDKCGLVDLVRLSCVCKSWRASASLSTKSSPSLPGRHPWLLLYADDRPKCLLLEGHSHQEYFINVPQLKGATCLASSQGWLLLSQKGASSLFFFNPFSRARLDLPRLPVPLSVTDRVAAFSYTPTCKDCVVSVPVRNKETGLSLLLLSRGDHRWTRRELGYTDEDLGSIVCATWYRGKFWFGDKGNGTVSFSLRDESSEKALKLPFGCWKQHGRYWQSDISGLWGKHAQLLSTCGTLVPQINPTMDSYIVNQTSDNVGSHVRGIWLYPAGIFDLPSPVRSGSLHPDFF